MRVEMSLQKKLWWRVVVEGEELKRRSIDLESFWSPWKDAGKVTLKAGNDFDVVVFGISLASISYLCAELVAASDAWSEMVKNPSHLPEPVFPP